MRRAIGVLLLVACVVIDGVAGAITAWESGVDGIAVSDWAPGQAGGPGQTGDEGSAVGGGSGQTVYGYWAIGWDVDHFCRFRGSTTDKAVADSYAYALQRIFAAGNAAGSTALCPNNTAPANPAAAPTGPGPDALARQFWDVRILPAPTPTIVPDYAITGKPVYLQIGGDQQRRFDVPDPLGPPITIVATSEYVVDWGDGTVQSTRDRGGPWPDGTLTHTYTNVHPHQSIRVAQGWSATWSAGPGQQGALDNLQTGGALTFTVTQVQAVRN